MDKTPLIFLEAAAHVGRDDLFDSRADEVTKGEQAVSVLEARSVFDRKWRANEAKQHLLDKLDQKSVGKPRLFELIEIYERDKPALSEKTKRRTQRYLQRFIEVVGDMKPSQVTRDHVIRFRDALEVKKHPEANVNQHIDKLTALFNVALSAGAVTSNPAYKIKAREREKATTARDKGFSEID